MTRVVILTGERGVGKTTVCRETIALARVQGYECGGVLTLARDDTREVYDVRSGDTRRLTQESGEGHGVVQGRFQFSPSALRWGAAVLQRSVPCDLLVIDELGPLEIERDKGWARAFDVLDSGGFAMAVVVVRPELVARAQLRLPEVATTVLDATWENRDRLSRTLIAMLERET